LQGAPAPDFPPELREQAEDPLVGGNLRAQAERVRPRRSTSLGGPDLGPGAALRPARVPDPRLREQITSSDRQLSLLAQQRKDIGFLVEQQLARKSQLFELERQIASVSGQRATTASAWRRPARRSARSGPR
jgi:hypothetical protein